MAEVIQQIDIDSSKVKDTWVQGEVVRNDIYNAINKAVIDLKNNNNLLDSNAMLFREAYNSSSGNLNNAIHQGIYSFTNSAVNAPSGVTGGNLLVTNTSKTNQDSSIITQIAFCHNGAVYARTKNTSENFTAWNKLAYITDNVASATKATQDSEGKAINTTYLKRSGGQMTGNFIVAPNNGALYLKNGTQAKDGMAFWVGNDSGDIGIIDYNREGKKDVLRCTPNGIPDFANGVKASGGFTGNLSGTATNATNDQNGMNISTGFLNRNRGDIPSKNFDDAYIEGLYNFGNSEKNRPCDYGRLLTLNNKYNSTDSRIWQLALPTQNNNLRLRTRTNGEAWLNWRTIPFTDSPAFSGSPTAPTPGTDSKSTRVATTAFVHSLLGRAVGRTPPTLTALIDWETMKSVNGGVDVRNIRNTSTGITAYGGDAASLNKGDIILKQSFTPFDALLIKYTHDDGWWIQSVIIPIWEFNIMFYSKAYFHLLRGEDTYWQIRGNGCSSRPSTTTRLNVRDQNSGIIEIYGVTH